MESSRILDRLAPRYDQIVTDIYRAGSETGPWLAPLIDIAEIFEAWTVQLLGINKVSGVMSFSYEAGSASAEAALDYLHRYHRLDPRLQRAIALPPWKWMACEEHFDEAFVESSPFYRDYLIPYGGRYLCGTKLHEDASSVALIGHVSRVGNPPLSVAEKAVFAKLAEHFAKAMDINKHLAAVANRQSLGLGLLQKMRQPIILVGSQRNIMYCNDVGAQLLARRDPVLALDGVLACRNADDDLDLTIALRQLGLVPITTHGATVAPVERRSLRLQKRDNTRVAGTLLALRPESVKGSFGGTAQALFTLYEPGAAIDLDPFLLGTTFDLTPAEGRLAAKIACGISPDDCAELLGVKITTIRTQLKAIFSKTGTKSQADLVRLIMLAMPI